MVSMCVVLLAAGVAGCRDSKPTFELGPGDWLDTSPAATMVDPIGLEATLSWSLACDRDLKLQITARVSDASVTSMGKVRSGKSLRHVTVAVLSNPSNDSVFLDKSVGRPGAKPAYRASGYWNQNADRPADFEVVEVPLRLRTGWDANEYFNIRIQGDGSLSTSRCKLI